MIRRPPSSTRTDTLFPYTTLFRSVFEPGSVMKAFTAVAALESGKFTPDTLVDTSPGYTMLQGGYTIHDFRDYGTLSLTGVLVKSTNVGAIKIANQLSPSQQYSAYHRFGLGQTSGTIGRAHV